MDEVEDYHDDGTPDYIAPEKIGPNELHTALKSLALFEGDPNLSQQAFSLGLVDGAAMQLEADLLRKQFNEEPYVAEAAFLNALSQMWIFAAYELLRTWRQRAKNMIKWAESGGLKMKRDELRKETGFTHFGKEIVADQIDHVISNPATVEKVRADLRRTYMTFARIEAIRVSIAKHEVRGRKNSVALMPTYGRINRYCGSLDYELGIDRVSLGEISRRDIADSLRAIPEMPVPTDEEIEEFDSFMHGPTLEELADLFATSPKEG